MRAWFRSPVTQSVMLLAASASIAHAADRAAVVACTPQGLRGAAVRGLAESDALARSIAAAPDVERARELALEPVRTAARALDGAEALMPWREAGLEHARTRLASYERAVTEARDPAAVAGQYDRLTHPGDASLDGVRVADLGGPAADVHVGDVGCDYSTGEIIAVVIGFILAIIPGIILLIVLC